MASAAWDKRNARAQALGYESYYDYRSHDNGRIPPSEPRMTGEALSRSRGHRGAADLERLLQSGRVELVNTVSTVDARGRFGVDMLVTTSDGRTLRFRVSDPQARVIGGVIDDMGTDGPPVIGSPKTLARFGAGDEDEFDDRQEFEDFDEAA